MQFINIIISIIRSKIVAVLLGPSGMGISGLFNSITTLVGGFTNLGLSTSAVKNVAEANASGDAERIARISTVLNRWIWISGLIGTIITIIFSPLLSQLTFGNKKFTVSIIWVSISLLFIQLNNGHLVVLQGLRKLQYLAKANLVGAFCGLLITVPIYYFWKIDGIVPAIILTTFVSMLISWYFSNKIHLDRVPVSGDIIIKEGSGMIKMGIMLTISGLLSIGASYLVRIYISHFGGLEEVGLYNAGFAIINTYVGMVFTAMGTDFYPRLSEVAQNRKESMQLINHQAEIAILILSPILCIFLVFVNWIIIVLYSAKFLQIDGMLQWAAMGMYFKAASWSIAFILLAKGNSKLFFINELLANLYFLAMNLLCYKLWGLNGLGISFIFSYFLYLIQIFVISGLKYRITFKAQFYKLFFVQLCFGSICFIVVSSLKFQYAIIVGIITSALSIFYSLNELNKRIQLVSMVLQIKNKLLNKPDGRHKR